MRHIEKNRTLGETDNFPPFISKKCNEMLPKWKHPHVGVKKVRGRIRISYKMKKFVEITPRTIRYDDVPCLAMVLLRIWSR